jgi:hypothetical protein
MYLRIRQGTKQLRCQPTNPVWIETDDVPTFLTDPIDSNFSNLKDNPIPNHLRHASPIESVDFFQIDAGRTNASSTSLPARDDLRLATFLANERWTIGPIRWLCQLVLIEIANHSGYDFAT